MCKCVHYLSALEQDWLYFLPVKDDCSHCAVHFFCTEEVEEEEQEEEEQEGRAALANANDALALLISTMISRL